MGYAITAQYYDPFAAAAHDAVDRRIGAALAVLDPALGPVVDIGAGTGRTVALIAATLPEVEILAVEPDETMRAALMTRIWADPDLRQRVTILPFDILKAPLPSSISGAVISASLVHLGPADRASLWPMLARRLSAEGRIIVEVQCPDAVDVAEAAMARVQVGRIRYDGSAAAERIGPDRQRWRMTYRASMDGVEFACDVATYDCWTISADRILTEAAVAGLAGDVVDDLVLLRSGGEQG